MVYKSTRMKEGRLLQINANNTVNSRIDFKLTGFVVIRGLKYRRSLKFHIGITNTTSCFVHVKDGSKDSRNCWWEGYYTIPELEENNEPKICLDKALSGDITGRIGGVEVSYQFEKSGLEVEFDFLGVLDY